MSVAVDGQLAFGLELDPVHTHEDLTWSGQPFWDPAWAPCDLGLPRYWLCARDHGVDAPCSAVYRLTHPVHRVDLPTCYAWPCSGRRCQQPRP